MEEIAMLRPKEVVCRWVDAFKSLFNISPRPPWRHIFRPDCVKNPCNPSGLLRLFALQGKKSISPIRTR